MRTVEIETPRLRLLIPSVDEAFRALEYFKDNREHLRPTDPVLPRDYYTLAFWERRLALSIEEFKRDQSVRLFFELGDKPERTIGAISFTQIARGPFQACYLGYSIDHRYQGQGLMFEALQFAIRYMFTEKHIHRIMANHLPENKRSSMVLKRLGFRVDGSSPDYLFIQGVWREHVLTSLTNPSWTPRDEERELFHSH
jgi:ribosomal-protein-alanine N-acetyltransferase